MNLTPTEIEQIQGGLLLVSTFLPTNVQKYVKDFAVDGPLVFDALAEFKSALASLPARNVRTAADIAKAFGVPEGTPGYALARLYDAITTQIEEARNPQPVPLPFAPQAVRLDSNGNPISNVNATNPSAPGYQAAGYQGAGATGAGYVDPVTGKATGSPQGPVK